VSGKGQVIRARRWTMRQPKKSWKSEDIMNLLLNRTVPIQIILVAILVLSLSACSATRSLIASFQSTDHFLTLASDPRVLYEPGAEANARDIVPLLPEAISKVEKRQYLPFRDPVNIYVCASAESYYKLTGTRARAVVTNKLFLSPALFQDRPTLPLYLTHELSHLHLLQRLGTYRMIELPSWFKEGLATFVSGGGGAPDISDEQALNAIRSTQNFVPDEGQGVIGSLLFPRYGSYWKLDNHMFYRQGMLFVAFMQKTDENSFRKFLISIQQGEDFSTALMNAYNKNLSRLWEQFIEEIKGRNDKNTNQTRVQLDTVLHYGGCPSKLVVLCRLIIKK